MVNPVLDYHMIITPERNNKRIIIGSLGIIPILVILFIKLTNPITFIPWWIYLLVLYLFVYGIFHFYEGLGNSFVRLFGNAYVKIDYEKIRFKPSVTSKKLIINWENIDIIEFKQLSVKFYNKDNTFPLLKYGELDYSLMQKIKQSISEIAALKNIQMVNS
jgi:hypothetical protein